MSPSVRGAERIRVVALLLASGVATGAVAGFAAGALWSALHAPTLATWTAVLVALLALAGDLAHRLGIAPPPLAVRRQVPQEWGRLLGVRTAAVLYGARLGIGPLTILTSWSWWAALVVASSGGPWSGAAVGATFHAARTATMLAAVAGARRSMSTRMAAVQRSDGRASLALALVLGGWLLVLAAR